jgi:hypothetical protein
MPCNHRKFRLCADLRVVCGIGENDQAFVRELGDLVFDLPALRAVMELSPAAMSADSGSPTP